MKKVLLFILLSILFVPSLMADCNNIDSKLDAIKSVADAYYYRGGALQYDDISMTQNGVGEANHKIVRKRRAHIEQSPEEATIQDIKYTVCSEFIHAVFYEAFTKDGVGYTIKNTNGNDLGFLESSYLVKVADKTNATYYNERIAIYYANFKTNTYSVNDENIEINSSNYKQVFQNVLQPGDIIVYKYNTWGHVLLYLGDDKIINASSTSRNKVNYVGYNGTGGNYDYKNKKDNLDPWGTVGYVSLEEDVLNYKDQYSKYVFEDGTHTSSPTDPSITELSILRPFNELNNSNINAKTCHRIEHSKLVRTKTSSVNKYQSIQIGDTITYTITLENKSEEDNYNNITVTDVVPNNTKFIAFGGDVTGQKNNNNLSWILNIPANSSKTISYTIKALKEGVIINDSTIADNIQLNKIETYVSQSLNNNINSINNLVNNAGNSYTNIDNLISSIYPNYDIPSTNDIFKTFFAEHVNEDEYFAKYDYKFQVDTTNNNSFGHKHETGLKDLFILKDNNEVAEKYRKMYVNGLFGGVFTIKQGDTYSRKIYEDYRNKTWSKSDFMVGDILYVYNDDYEANTYMYSNNIINAYIYIDDNKFATVYNGALKVFNNEESNRLLESLLGHNSFIVIRPSNNIVTERIEINTIPKALTYTNNPDELDLTGGSIMIYYSDNTTKVLDMTDDLISVTDINKINNKAIITLKYVNQELNMEYYLRDNQVYVVTADANEGTVTETTGWTLSNDQKTATKGLMNCDEYGKLPEPIRTGYIFDAWYTSKTGGNKILPSAIVQTDSNYTIYARWINKNEVFNQNNKYTFEEEKKIIIFNEDNINKTAYLNYVQLLNNYTLQMNLGNNTLVYTGSKAKVILDNNEIFELTNIVLGDVNGDGKISSKDYISIRKHLMETTIITDEAKLIAANYNQDNKISSKDYVQIRKYLMSS